ncbi:MAG: RNA polymerase sigma factor [Ilumatobacter sp.]
MDVVDAALARLVRQDAPRVLALLAGRYGQLHLADDAVADALASAADRWPTDGVPDNPAAWLNHVANRKAIDLLRRGDADRRRTLAAAPEFHADRNDTATMHDSHVIDDPAADPNLPDDQLRLMFLCCHPALAPDAQVALTLRLIGGLSTDEIAAAYLIPTPTLAQRISRAKAKIRDAAIPLSTPSQLEQRLAVVLSVLYLVFNEGYLSRGENHLPVRVDLCEESMRLTRALAELLPEHPEVQGLLALELFHHARRDARLDDKADLVLLPDQDRALWHRDTIDEGNAVLTRAMAHRAPNRFQLEAAIAAYHANATDAAETDWPRIAALYDRLLTFDPSPVVALNRAVAIGMADGPDAGLAALPRSDELTDYHLFHAAKAELRLMAGDVAAAETSFIDAHRLARNAAEMRHLERRLAVTAQKQPPH